MDYKEKYEKAVQAAMLAKQDTESAVTIRILEEIFPELKESEDERIRKEIIDYLSTVDDKNLIPYESWIAYLEKQGEHANFRNKIQIGDKVTRNEDGMLVNMSQFKRVAKKDEKQGVQKPADKIEPKFRVGDVIRPKGSTAEYTIESISGECYHGKGWGLHISCDDDYELVEQKPAWSEEDESHIRYLIECLEHCKKGVSLTMTTPTAQEYIDWLKLLRPQSAWKPSEEQMYWLKWAANRMPDTEKANEAEAVLEELLNQLKKLIC